MRIDLGGIAKGYAADQALAVLARQGIDRALVNFRARAITRPGSDAVAQGLADIVQLEQRLPVRWPIGEDCVRMTQLRRDTDDDTWERERLAMGWGITREDLEALTPDTGVVPGIPRAARSERFKRSLVCTSSAFRSLRLCPVKGASWRAGVWRVRP